MSNVSFVNTLLSIKLYIYNKTRFTTHLERRCNATVLVMMRNEQHSVFYSEITKINPNLCVLVVYNLLHTWDFIPILSVLFIVFSFPKKKVLV